MSVDIVALEPDEISRFLVRQRRDWGIDELNVRLDVILSEILAKANDFVPSESGCLLLDDPRAKGRAQAINTLTFIACFGPTAKFLLGRQTPIEQGIAGHVYKTRTPYVSPDANEDPRFYQGLDTLTGYTTHSLIAVPVIVGESIFGVLELINRRGESSTYDQGDLLLLETFAGYISSSIQNALDAIRAREVARRDDLTGLYNDRYLHYRLEEEIPRADRNESPLSMIFLDLDYFKRVNDRHGHLVGSRTLKEIGYLVNQLTPPGGIPARYGGDEFVIILPGYTATDALDVAERLRELIETAELLVISGPSERPLPLGRPVTCSVGVSSLIEHVAPHGSLTRRQNALIRLADTAMYEAKGAGKNRVCVADPELREETEGEAGEPNG